LQGWGDCIFQVDTNSLDQQYAALRYIVRIIAGPRGEGVVKVPFGAVKGAEVRMLKDKIISNALANDEAKDTALSAYGMKTIISATPADIDKAPKLSLLPK
jgi:hypothetical protein